MIAGLTACSSKKQKFEFDHAQEAIAACHQELATVKAQKDATIDELVARINTWQIGRASCRERVFMMV